MHKERNKNETDREKRRKRRRERERHIYTYPQRHSLASDDYGVTHALLSADKADYL